MANLTLTVTARPKIKAAALRAEGYIPAIIYGPGTKQKVLEVGVEYQAFRKTFRQAGESTLIDLTFEGKTLPVLVHDLSFHPVTGEFEHIDFFAMDMEQEVHTHISLTFTGIAPVIKEKNGMLVTSKESLEVKCLPKDLVHDLSVDVSGLEEYHQHILVKDVIVPDGITVLDDPEATVVTANPPQKEEAPQEVVAAEGAETAAAPVEGEKAEAQKN